jgi:hypothetical protein
MNKFESPAMSARATLKVNVLKKTALLCNRLEENFDYNFPKQAGSRQYTVTTGRKYHKIIDANSVHCFVDKNTGEVYKAASYKAPAKGVRYDLRLIEDFDWLLSHADWCGRYLYARDVKFAHLK